MTDKHRKEATIFDIARRIDDAEARNDYLTQACGDNQTLRKRIRELLQLDEKESIFDRDPIGISSIPTAAELEIESSEICLLYTSPSPRDQRGSRMPSSA